VCALRKIVEICTPAESLNLSATHSGLNEGIKMSVKTNKLIAFASTALLSIVGVGAISTPANAAACPYPVENQAANDKPVNNLRLISPSLTDDNSIRRYDFESQFTMDCDWFGVGMRFNQAYVPFGLRTNLVFQATSATGVPLANTKVTLRANKGYSSSNAAVKVNGIKARPAPSNASDGANVIGTTDVNGVVNFVVASPDDCEAYGGMLPAAPANPGADTPNDTNADPTTDCFSQFLPSITGEKTDSADFVELHYYDPAALSFTATDATVSLLAPTLRAVESPAGKANALDNNGTLQAYAPIASKQVIAFQALKANGSFAMNQPVTVRINLANSGATAKISAGIFSVAGFVAPLPANPSKTAEDQLVLTGTTDAFGVVAFSLNNTDTVAGAPPKTSTTAIPAGSKFSRISAEITGKVNTGSPVEFHYYKPVPPTSITAAAVGRKINVTLNYAKGKKSTITITGLKAVSVTPTVDKKVYAYTVKKGKITVKVTSNGKTLTKVFTVK
jgi:hypothetical protein